VSTNRIPELRRAAGLSQRQLAQCIRLSHSYLADVERGRQPVSELMAYRLARTLNCSEFDLFGRSGLRVLPAAYDGAGARDRIAMHTIAPSTGDDLGGKEV
jgi:transcriptional regulator with XRE-family HTH domain